MAEHSKALARRLGLFEAVTIGIGGMIGGAIFEAIGVVAGIVGPSMVFSFAFAAVVAALTGYSYTKLGPMFPESGGSFTYIYRAFRGRFLSVFVGYMLWFSYAAASSLYALGFALYSHMFLGGIPDVLVAISLVIAFMGVNMMGVREMGVVQNLLVSTKVSVLVFLIGAALGRISSSNFEPMFPHGMFAVLLGSSVIFIGYEGFDIIGTSAEELKDPKKTIPRAIYISIAIVSTLYILVSLVSVGVVRYDFLAKHGAPLALVAEKSIGITGATILGLGGLISTASALNAALYGASRVAYNLSIHNILPKHFSRLSARSVPYVPIAITSLIIALLSSLSFSTPNGAKFASALSSASFMLIFFLVTLSNYRLRTVTRANTRLLQVTVALFILAMLLLLIEDPLSWTIVVGWVVLSLVADVLFRKYAARSFYYTPEDSGLRSEAGSVKERRKKIVSRFPAIKYLFP